MLILCHLYAEGTANCFSQSCLSVRGLRDRKQSYKRRWKMESNDHFSQTPLPLKWKVTVPFDCSIF